MSVQAIRDLFGFEPPRWHRSKEPRKGKSWRQRTLGRGPNPHRRKSGPGRKAKHRRQPAGTKLLRYFAKNAT